MPCQMWHLWHFWHKWHIRHMTSILSKYVDIGVKRSVRTSGMQHNVLDYPKKWFYHLKIQNFDDLVFPLYFQKFPLYIIKWMAAPPVIKKIHFYLIFCLFRSWVTHMPNNKIQTKKVENWEHPNVHLATLSHNVVDVDNHAYILDIYPP